MTGLGPVAVRQPRVRDRDADAPIPAASGSLVDPAALHALVKVDRDAAAHPISDGRSRPGDFSEATGSAARQGRCRPGCRIRHRPAIAQGRFTGSRRTHRVAEARSVGQALPLLLGPMASTLTGTPRRREVVHPGADRRDAGRPQGTGRLHRWRPRERAGLARSAARPGERRGLGACAAAALRIADAHSGSGRPPARWPKTREQRCRVHKTANVLAKLPKSQQPNAKRALQEIWMAEPRPPPSWRSTPSWELRAENRRRRPTA